MVKKPVEEEDKAIEPGEAEAPTLDIAPPEKDVLTPEDAKFAMEVEKLIRSAEEKRVHYMKQSRNRGFLALNVGLLALIAGGGGFGWYFLMEGNLTRALSCIGLAAAVPFLLTMWAQLPRRRYAKNYKRDFMPQMAELLGRLQFHPERGINAKILPKTGIVPRYTKYVAEDCFMGRYHGVKIILSEARLWRADALVFDGILVYLEAPPGITFPGHTIITADQRAVKSWRSNRWQKFSEVPIAHSDYAAHFQIFATQPDKAASMISADLLKEMLEMSVLFESSPLSASFFAGNRVFLTIPHDADMFEPSHIEYPVTTHAHALRCKHEIEQILSIIDIIELYGKKAA
jgi:hypothetical protein